MRHFIGKVYEITQANMQKIINELDEAREEIQKERARSLKLIEALVAIVWSWENDAGRDCFGTAEDALDEYNKEKSCE